MNGRDNDSVIKAIRRGRGAILSFRQWQQPQVHPVDRGHLTFFRAPEVVLSDIVERNVRDMAD